MAKICALLPREEMVEPAGRIARSWRWMWCSTSPSSLSDSGTPGGLSARRFRHPGGLRSPGCRRACRHPGGLRPPGVHSQEHTDFGGEIQPTGLVIAWLLHCLQPGSHLGRRSVCDHPQHRQYSGLEDFRHRAAHLFYLRVGDGV